MEFVQYSILYMLKNIGLMLIDPIFYLLALAVTYLYTRQIRKFQSTKDDRVYTYHAIKNIIIGTCVGLFVSSVLSFYGHEIIVESNVLLLVPVAMGLMMINPKFGCFSYVVTVAYLIEGLLQSFMLHTPRLDYNILVMLVGALHIIEGTLVMLAGSTRSVRTIIYRNKELVVQEVLHQIWLVPIVFTLTGYTTPVPVYAILAYNDLANKGQGVKQSVLTGTLIFIFGMLIYSFSLYAKQQIIPMGAVIVLMPVLHEFIFLIGQGKIKQATCK